MKFNKRDAVEVVNYGHWIMVPKDVSLDYPVIEEANGKKIVDMLPEIVGKIGAIREFRDGKYALDGIPEKVAWYDEEQLKAIKNAKK